MIGQFRGYQRSWLRGDVVAGLTVAAYLIPQVMAYATVAGLPPVAGLWAAIVPMAGYAVFGSSRTALGRPRIHHRVDDSRGAGSAGRW